MSLLKRFVKKILEKFLGEGEKDVENARGMKEDAQRDTSNNEEQQKSKQLDEILKDLLVIIIFIILNPDNINTAKTKNSSFLNITKPFHLYYNTHFSCL